MNHFGRFVLGAAGAVALCPAAAAAQTFSYTGGEQTFAVPPSAHAVEIVATGASGGGPLTGLTPGRGAMVSGTLSLTPGDVLYVEVGGTGGQPAGGFNGGGDSAVLDGLSAFGGGGASDVRLISSSAGGSLASRLLVAAGGGGSASPAAAGGDAGAPGFSSPGSSVGGGAGTQTGGGAGGCDVLAVGCGADGSLGIGGAGGSSGSGPTDREGAGGGGGLYGGGGGAGVLDGAVGGGGGGSSLVPANGLMMLAPLGTPPSVVITALGSAGGNDLPVTGSGAGTVTFDPSTSSGTTEIAGQLSHLGAFTASGPFHLTATGFSPPLVPFDVNGTTTFVAANGDELFGSFTGTATNNLDTGVFSGLNVITITGGTGRFADASGTLAEPYTVTGSVITAKIQGQINP